MVIQFVQYFGNFVIGQVYMKFFVNVYCVFGYYVLVYNVYFLVYNGYLSLLCYNLFYLCCYSFLYIDSVYSFGYKEFCYGFLYNRLVYDDFEYCVWFDCDIFYF